MTVREFDDEKSADPSAVEADATSVHTSVNSKYPEAVSHVVSHYFEIN